MDERIITAAMRYVKNVFENEYSGHDFYHTERVYKMASFIAKEEYADVTMVQLAALLHDVDDRKLSPETYRNKDRAVAFMKEQGIDADTIGRICTIIGEIAYAGEDSVVPSTIEGMCVQDADRLDAIGAIGVARAFAYGGNHNRKMYDPAVLPNTNMSGEQYFASESTSLNHFYEKLFKLEGMMNTSAARKIAAARTSFMHDFVDRFLAEWNGTDV